MKPVMVRPPFRPPKCVRNVSEQERATVIPFEATLPLNGFEQHADDRHVVIRPAVVGAQWREEGGGGGGCCNKARIPWHLCLTTRAFHLLLFLPSFLPPFLGRSFPSHICHGELGSKELAAPTDEQDGMKERRRGRTATGRARMCLQSESKLLCRQFAVEEERKGAFEAPNPKSAVRLSV